MGKTYFTADEHHDHENMIHHCSRPYANTHRMRKSIVARANETLSPGDRLIHGGDFFWGGPERKLVMYKTVKEYRSDVRHDLVFGNHERLAPFDFVEAGFTVATTALELVIDGFNVVVVHDPSVRCVLPKDYILICGHVHTLFKSIADKRTVNVGVDMWDFRPVSFDQIREELGI